MGVCICGLVQPPAPPQRDQIRDAPPAPQWSRQGHLPAASRGLRGRPPGQSNALEPKHPLLAPTRRSVDQQATGRARTALGVTIDSRRLSGSPGVTSFLKVTVAFEAHFSNSIIPPGPPAPPSPAVAAGSTGVRIVGTSGPDTIVGTEANDSLSGGDGNDLLKGLGGNDRLFGDSGNDTLNGGSGNDVLAGGRGSDVLRGGKGDDALFGGRGRDSITGGEGVDVMRGGAGADQFNYNTLKAIPTQTGIEVELSDLIADFSSNQGDTIRTGTAGTSSNYSESASQLDFDAALAAANAMMAGETVIYYFTQSIADAGVGLLFIDSNSDGSADAVIRFAGVQSADFDFARITA